MNTQRLETGGLLRGLRLDAKEIRGFIEEFRRVNFDSQYLPEEDRNDYSVRTFGSVVKYARQMTVHKSKQPAFGDLVAVEEDLEAVSIVHYDGSQKVYGVILRWDGESLPVTLGPVEKAN